MPILTPPPTWSNGPVTAAMMNARIRDQIAELQAAFRGDPWANMTLVSGHEAMSGNETPQVRFEAGNAVVRCQGRIKKTSGAFSGNTDIATLPTGMAPLVATIYPAACDVGSMRITVLTDGRFRADVVSGSPTWVSLAGVCWPLT